MILSVGAEMEGCLCKNEIVCFTKHDRYKYNEVKFSSSTHLLFILQNSQNILAF